MVVAASPQSINRAMPEGDIQVTSHQSLVTPNPQSLIPSYSSLLSNFRRFNGGGAKRRHFSHQPLVTSHQSLLIPHPSRR